MKPLLALGVVALALGVRAQQASLPPNIKQMFERQLAASAHQTFRYGKHVLVTDAQGNTRSDEFREYRVVRAENDAKPMLMEIGGSTQALPFFPEVSYAVEYFFQEAAIADNYEYVQRGDTLLAYIKQDCKAKCDLQAQKIVLDAQKRRIRYLETHIRRTSWLYSSTIQTKIYFSNDGLYQQHTMCFHTDIVLLTSENYTCVHGRARY